MADEDYFEIVLEDSCRIARSGDAGKSTLVNELRRCEFAAKAFCDDARAREVEARRAALDVLGIAH